MSLISPRHGYALEHIEGDHGSMAWWAAQFDRVGDRLNDLVTSVQTVQNLPGKGRSITAARQAATDTSGMITPDIAEAELLATVLRQYADAYSRHAEPANKLIADIEAAHAVVRVAAEDHRWAVTLSRWAAQSGPDTSIIRTFHDEQDCRAALDAAEAALAELWETWETHYAHWDAAYDAALAALVAAAGTSGPALSRDARALLDGLLFADTPADVLALWAEHADLHDELTQRYGAVLGNLDGIPYDVRAELNEARLVEMVRRTGLAEPLVTELDSLRRELRQGGRLIAFDPAGSAQTTAALWYGPFDASTVSTLVPGMMSEVSGIGDWGESARDLNAMVGPPSATVAWFGYDSPNFAEEPQMDRAKDGGAALRSFLLGLDAVASTAEINVIAHSYGSTTAAWAIGSSPDGTGVDTFITVGSAGLPDNEDILHNLQSPDAPRIYATQAESDSWAPIGKGTSWGHRTNPMSLDGATVFESDGAVLPDGAVLLPTPGHSAHNGVNYPWQSAPGGYLQEGSESFYNVAQIVQTGEPAVGLPDAVTVSDWLKQRNEQHPEIGWYEF